FETTVLKLDHRVDDRLGMHDDLDLVVADAKEPVRLDNFESFVHHGRRIDGDLSPHRPGWMLQRVGGPRSFHLVLASGAERTAGSREDRLGDSIARFTLKALPDSGMLTVDGEESSPAPGQHLRDELASGAQRLLVGEHD